MINIKFKKLLLFIICLAVLLIPYGFSVNTAVAKNEIPVIGDTHYVVVGGESIGLSLNTTVKITGMFEVNTDNGKVRPWLEAGLKIDDEIFSIAGKEITNIEGFKNVLNELKDTSNPVSLKIRRNDEIIDTNINVVKNSKGVYSLGLYVKDSVLGVGTITYYNISDKTFGALGHSAITSTVYSGSIYNSTVTGIVKGVRGIPGEKKAILNSEVIGTITLNNDFGIFGTFNEYESSYELTPVGSINEIRLGEAEIITVINGTKKEVFTIEITDIDYQKQESIKGIKFRVTDEELINKTGGIIQGMSGSPIIQDGKLIGAVSHVLVDDSTIGYGVFAQWMINYS